MFENRRRTISQQRNDSRSELASISIHNSLIQYFVAQSVGKDIPILKAVYLSELISVEMYARLRGEMKDGKWFQCPRKHIIEKYKISESGLRGYDELFQELGLIERRRERTLSDPFVYYSLNHERIDEILSNPILEYYDF